MAVDILGCIKCIPFDLIEELELFFRPAFRESIAKVIELKNVSVGSMRLFLKLISGEIGNFDVSFRAVRIMISYLGCGKSNKSLKYLK